MEVVVGNQHHVAAVAAIAPVGSAVLHILLAVKADCPVAAAAGF
ncbi:hypothetical protein SDC9_162418 [bioreactor metagenome]|uniref:Uncharacterized protein n=1 Tax=bioreactor metagenome TaxID=1076179 RepID=A0A645FP13_9ZZZZ